MLAKAGKPRPEVAIRTPTLTRASVYPFRSWEKGALSPRPHAPHLQWSEPSDPLKPPWPPQELTKSSGRTRGFNPTPVCTAPSCSLVPLLRSLGATATARLAHSLLLALRPMAWGGVGLRHLHCVFRSSPSARIARFPPAAARARRVRMELGAAAVAVAVTAESECVRLWGGAATRAPVQPPPHPALGWRLGRTVMGVGRRMAEGGGRWRTIVSCPPPPRSQGESEGERSACSRL